MLTMSDARNTPDAPDGLTRRQTLAAASAVVGAAALGGLAGSGMTFHDLRTFFKPVARGISETFDAWLRETAVLPPSERDARLAAWAEGRRLGRRTLERSTSCR